MIAVIHKYVLDVEDVQEIDMRAGAEILNVASINDSIYIWAKVDPNAEKVKRRFGLAGTGSSPVGHEIDGRYIGMAVTMNGLYVWQVYDYGEV